VLTRAKNQQNKNFHSAKFHMIETRKWDNAGTKLRHVPITRSEQDFMEIS